MPINPSTISKISSPVNAALALLIGYVLAQLALDILPRAQRSTPASSFASGASTSGPSAQQMARDIASAHLFGEAGNEPVATVQPTRQTAPDTKLNLTLHGVLAYSPPENSLAIISSGGNREEVYAIGDKIVGNTTLQAVFADRVIIRRSGKNETLRLPENFAALGVAGNLSTQLNPSGNGSGDLPGSAKKLRERLVRQPSEMAKLFTMRPYKRNGKRIGYRIQPKRDPELLAGFGIQPGDIITSINGIELTSNRQGAAALKNLISAKTIDLTVLRGGAEVPLSISLQ